MKNLTQYRSGNRGESITQLHERLALFGFEVPVAEQIEDQFGPGTEAAIRTFQATHGLTAHGSVDEATARGLGLGEAPGAIAGIVCKPDGAPVADVAVRLVQRAPGADRAVAETLSGKDGRFSLPWPAGISAGLVVRTDGAERTLTWQETAADATAWVRLSVGGAYRGTPQLARITAALVPAVPDGAVHALAGTGRGHDIAALGHIARVPARDVSRYVLAHKLASRTQLTADIWFALLVHQLTPAMQSALDPSAGDAAALDDGHVERVLDRLIRQPHDATRDALAAAVADNTIAELDVDAAARTVHAARIDHLAARPLQWSPAHATSDHHACCARPSEPTASAAPASDAAAPARLAARPAVELDGASLDDVLATVLPDAGSRRRVVAALAGGDGSARLASLVDQVAELSADQRSQVRFALETAALLGNHLPLVQHVQAMRAAGAIRDVRDLARLDADDWTRMLREAVPAAGRIANAQLAGASAAGRIPELARRAARQLEDSYPTAALAGRLAKDPAAVALPRAGDVQRLLDALPDLCIVHSHIDRVLHDAAASLPAGANDPAAVSDLKTLQRGYRLAERFDTVRALFDAGHHSAHSVYARGPEQFAAQMTAAGATAEDAQAIFARADQVHATAVTLMASFHGALDGAAPAAITAPVDRAAVRTALAAFPTVQSLFKTGDFCACSECRSIHGPASYLVDLLEFLKSRAASGGSNVREAIFARRPDLAQIKLSCANTAVEMPYVDLVCEALEDAVGSAPSTTDLAARQTTGTAEELRANPAFVRDAAYDNLRTANFPITGPFDLFSAEVRAYLRQIGVQLHELMAALQAPAIGGNPVAPSDAAIAGERLGLHLALFNLITTASPASPWLLWGLANTGNSIPDPHNPDGAAITGDWTTVLAYVPVLLDRAKVSHRELIQLLETRFLNPTGAIKVIQTADAGGFATCDTSTQSVQGWTADLLTRFNRLVRLWRRLGCTIWDLDKVMCAPGVGANVLDTTAIAQIGKLSAVAARLALPWDELLSLWGDIDRFNYVNVLDGDEPTLPSVYRRRFRNPTVTQATTVFVDDPSNLTGTLDNADATAGILAALDLSAADLRAIRASAGLGASTAPLNLANLSTITRYTVLARGLGMAIPDLIAAFAVTAINPLTGTLSLATTLAFFAALDRIQRSSFSLTELRYLLRHDAPVDSGLGLTDAAITVWLEDLRRSLVRLGSAGSAAAADLVVQRISAALSLDLNLTQRIVQATLPGGSQTIAALFTASAVTARNTDGTFGTATSRTNFASIYDAYTALDKMRILLARWQVSAADALWLVQPAAGTTSRAAAAGWLELHTLPANTAAVAGTPATLAALDTLRQNIVVQQTLAGPTGVRLFDFVLSPGASVAAAATSIAQLGGWADADIVALAGRFNLTTAAAMVAGQTVSRIRDAMTWSRKLGADVATTLAFVPTGAGATLGSTDARKARQLAKSRYTRDQWLAVSGAIQDQMREQKRAALVAYLLANPQTTRNQKWVTVEDLYGFYLIDPEMSPVATTSRVKQAIASVQLFVQRCLLQLESNVSVDVNADSLWKQWDWMKRFRLWEANRKIFLYPENWFDPALRHDTSPSFTALVDALQQADVTDDVAQDALRAYLHSLVDVAHLEVVGLWEEVGSGPPTILHVVARTRKTPYVYAYRRRDTTGIWTPWEPLDPGVETTHVMPAIWNKRLFMVWPEFTERSQPASSDALTNPTATAAKTAQESPKYWEVSLTWMERRGDVWLPKHQSQRKLLLSGNVNKREVVFRVGTSGRNLAVELYEPTLFPDTGSLMQAEWVLTSPQDEPIVLSRALGSTLAALDDARYIGTVTAGNGKIPSRPTWANQLMSWNFNAFGGDMQTNGNPAKLSMAKDVSSGLPTRDMLGEIARPRVISARFGETDQFISPFFVSDSQRTFFANDNDWVLQTFYHPFAETFAQQLSSGGIAGLYDRGLQIAPDTARGTGAFNFANVYKPTSFVGSPAPTETIDYTPTGPYAVYNWELFLHIPLLIARRLADNQRFDEALTWFHYIFNPTTVSGGSAPQRYWNPKVFRDLTDNDLLAQRIEALLQAVNRNTTPAEQAVVAAVAAWRANPFDPNLVAATRPVAYQKAVVMQYISTLIAWGDQLFRGDTIESINEATQLYLLASQLLGPRPQNLRALQPRQDKAYAELSGTLDKFANEVVEIENLVTVLPPGVSPGGGTIPTLHTFYFCIPPNDQMLSYWDLVADRLFKVRHGLNLQGIARPLPLFDPPIDPGLLVRAAAAGVDIAAALADTSSDVMCYRFNPLWQAAHDLTQDVRGLGSAILAALERRDGEEAARLRATQEVGVLGAMRQVKANQLDDAISARDALNLSREMAVARRDYYGSREFMNLAEKQASHLTDKAIGDEHNASFLDIASAGLALVPTFHGGANGWGGTPIVGAMFGGENLSRMAQTAANVLRSHANIKNQRAAQSNTLAVYQRRSDDWQLQHDLADKEIAQIDQQLIGAELRIAVARQELAVHDRQIADAQANEALLRSKFTSQELYDWMVSQLTGTYFHAYQLAYDLAKRASRTFAFDLGLGTPDSGIIQFGYWDNLHKGLTAGDKLLFDLRRLQTEYLNRNTRELEITKHVSLLQIDPGALVNLRKTGTAIVKFRESLFDLDFPGHFKRRLKSVGVTLPCITGPYTGINATLTLGSYTTRLDTALGGSPYAPLDPADTPSGPGTFVHGNAAQVVALSSGRDDTGVFEANLRDERFLPFEGLGAISQWQLDLPVDTNRFDRSTLSDVIFHVRYTARDAGAGAFRDAVRAAVLAPARSGFQLLSARSEFPDAYARLFAPTGAGQRLDLALTADHFPFVPSTHNLTITGVAALLLFTAEATYGTYAAGTALTTHLGFSPQDGSLPTTTASFQTAKFGGVPDAELTLSGAVAPITVGFVEADIAAVAVLSQNVTDGGGTVHKRLDASKIDDVMLLVNYQIAPKS